MKIEIFEASSSGGRGDEDILFDGILEDLMLSGIEIVRYDPVADQSMYEEARVSERLKTFRMPYFFVDGEFRLAGSYDVNKLNLKTGGCSGCKSGGCGKKEGCAGCKKKENCPGQKR